MSGDIVILKTPAQRMADEERAYVAAVQDEALGMLERAAALVREKGCAGLAISVVFNDGTFGRILPIVSTNLAGLIGAVGVTQHDLIDRTFIDEDT